MSFIFPNSPLITDEFTGPGGGGVRYLNGGVMAKMIAVSEGYFYLAYTGKFLRFDASEKTITIINELDFSSFWDDGTDIGKGLRPGRVIAVEGSVSNNDTYTIVSISKDGKTITVNESLTDEDCDNVSIFDDTIVTAINLYYNLVENSSEETYLSLTDKNAIQRFTISDIYASDTSPNNMKVGSASFGWVTNEITDEDSGETDEVTVEGVEITDHKQWFKITQTFRVTPYATNGQLNNFQNDLPPDYMTGGKALKYICRVDGMFDPSDPDVPHTGSSLRVEAVTNLGSTGQGPNGIANWFDQNNIRSRAEFYLDSVTGEIDIEKVNPIVITIKSRTGKFNAASSKLALDFLYVPLNEDRYINTPTRTLINNFLNDRYFSLITATGDGEAAGTEYQVLKDVVFNFIDANTIQVEFNVDFSAELKTFFKDLPLGNRNYIFSVTTQDPNNASTKQVDRVPVKTPVAQIAWDKSNPTLVEAVDNLRAYQFPQVGTNPYTTVSGFEGEPFYVEFPFRVKGTIVDGVSPTILKAGFQIIVEKTGQDDFILEEKMFDTSLVRKLNGVQTIDVSETKNFLDLPDEYNISSLRRDESFDDTGSGSDEEDMNGFLAHHAGLLRYDFWNSLILSAEQFQYDIFKEIEDPSQAWATLAVNGWKLKIKFIATVQGYEDFSEDFYQSWDINCKAVGDAPTEGPVFTSTVTYMDVETSLITNGISKGKKTLITRIFEGDFSSMPDDFNSFFAYVFADYENGGITTRRFASTEFDADEDSPFIAPPFVPTDSLDPNNSWASKNVRINVYNFTKVIVETIYDDSVSGWSFRTENLLIYPKLGFMTGCFMLTEGAVTGYVLDEDGQRILLENCES